MFKMIWSNYLDGKITREQVIRLYVENIAGKDIVDQTILMSELVNWLQSLIPSESA